MSTLDERVKAFRQARGERDDPTLLVLDLAAERERLLDLIKGVVAAYDDASPMRTADFHRPYCICLRCMVDRARATLASEPDA